jgi:hypothetical protein
MKRKFFLLLLIFQLAAAFAFADLRVGKSTFASSEISSAQDSPKTALNTRAGQTLVVWQRSITGGWDREILGRIVNAKGKTISKELKLAAGNTLSNPSVTYNPLLNEFLIAYDGDGSIFLRRVAANGKPSGKSIKITTDPISANASNYSPKVAFNPATQGYTVIWIRDDGASAIVVGLSVTKTGKVDGSVLEIHSGRLTLDLVCLPSGNKVLAVFYEVWDNGSALVANYYLATLDPFLKSVHVSKLNTKPVGRENEKVDWPETSLAVLPDSSAIAFYSDNAGVKGRKISSDGTLKGKPFLAFRPPENKTRLGEPSAVFSTTSNGTRGILVATEDHYPAGGVTSWAQVLDSTAQAIGAPILVNSTSETETTRAGQISVLPVGPGIKTFKFQFYQTVGRLGHFSSDQVAPLNTEILKFKFSLTEP